MVVPASCHPGLSAGIAALQIFYNLSTGVWDTTGWWNSANALETTINYTALTDSLTYRGNIFNTFEKHKNTRFLNKWFHDDDGWWALTWIKAYDLTGEPRYLDMAKTLFEDMKGGWDNSCGGGIWWKKARIYKNAITNELFLSIAAKLHLRSPNDQGPGSYLDWAQREWNWFKNSGMINRDNLVNDGLDDHCQNNGRTIWSYNQGVILGGLVDLYASTKDQELLTQAHAIAHAAIPALAPTGILQDVCEPKDCGDDASQFKGIFIRNLHYLYQTTEQPEYRDFITRNAESIWSGSRNPANQFGLSWAGPFDQADASRQSSAMDTINAAIAVNTQGISYQAESGKLVGVSVAAATPQYRGAGYISTWNPVESSVTLPIQVACSGNYDLVFRYAADADASRYLYLNGRRLVDNQVFPSTGNQYTWSQIIIPKVWLNAGHNSLVVIYNAPKGSHNSLSLDEIRLE